VRRRGFDPRGDIACDITQVDLRQRKESGWIEAQEVCVKIEGIGVVQFGAKDVVRHNVVQQIIRAYEDFEAVHPQRGTNANGKTVTAPKQSGPRESAKEPGQETQQG